MPAKGFVTLNPDHNMSHCLLPLLGSLLTFMCVCGVHGPLLSAYCTADINLTHWKIYTLIIKFIKSPIILNKRGSLIYSFFPRTNVSIILSLMKNIFNTCIIHKIFLLQWIDVAISKEYVNSLTISISFYNLNKMMFVYVLTNLIIKRLI